MFNTLFTSLPVIFLGIFEQDIRASTLLAVPELYTHGQRNEAFSIKKYFWWMFMATCEVNFFFLGMLSIKANIIIGNACILPNVYTMSLVSHEFN